MAFTPTDPTKAEVRILGTAPNQQFDFYIPRGAKGEPGGFTTPATLTINDNLDNITIPGMYRQSQNSGIPGSLLNNYPVAGCYGVLLVYQTNGNDVIQKFIRQSYNTSVDGRTEWSRNKSNNVWSPWRAVAYTRTSELAGRAIYAWDEANNREQLVWGDTGWRDVTTSVTSPFTAYIIRIRRIGPTVTVRWEALTKPDSAPGSSPFYTAPQGFQIDTQDPAYYSKPYIQGAGNSGTHFWAFGVHGASVSATSAIGSWSSGTYFNGGISYITTQPWPTSLPGTAVGSIPST